MVSNDDEQQRVLEGHFACGPGLLIDIECLSHGYQSRTSNHELEISLPTLKANWQEGFLDPPAWAYKQFKDTEQAAILADSEFEWGVTVGYQDNSDGTQSPEFARVRRWRFQTTIATSTNKFVYVAARGKFIEELEAWWTLLSNWISIFTRQDLVLIGKSGSGIRFGPIVNWNGDPDGLRVNGSRETSIPVVSDQGVDVLDHQTLLACMSLAADGKKPPDEWLFIRDARSLINARQYRRAVIDAGTAAELAMTALIDGKLTNLNFLEREKLLAKNRGLWELSNLMIERGAGTRPDQLQKDLAEPRNDAAHDGAKLSGDKAEAALAAAINLVEQLHPLHGFKP
jgi:hypothetical protein